MEKKLNKITILILALSFVVVVVTIVVIILINIQQRESEEFPIELVPTPVPLLYNTPEVLKTEPSYVQSLIPGQIQKFTITFTDSISDKPLQSFLTTRSITNQSDSLKHVSISSQLVSGGEILEIRTNEDILPSQEYSLTVIDEDGQTLVSATYTSSSIAVSPVKNNNQELRNYLPHETNNYRLIYLESTNTYIFNFKANSSSPDSYIDQYNQAKSDAEEFIRSRGIDLNSIIVEWRHS